MSEEITLPFTLPSLMTLVEEGAKPAGEYSHFEIAEWCYRALQPYWADEPMSPDMEAAAPVMEDIDAQWEMFLANSFTLEQLQGDVAHTARMPEDWFERWDMELRQLLH